MQAAAGSAEGSLADMLADMEEIELLEKEILRLSCEIRHSLHEIRADDVQVPGSHALSWRLSDKDPDLQ
jgi:hypothetical protein